MPLSPGARIGPYEIAERIGAGGMGEVYRARDSRLNRDVAIKTLPAAFFDDTNRLARLQREAQVLASLNHPNIAFIYGLEEDRGVRALVMELVEGSTLAERIAKGPIPLDEALAIARQIADALEAAHEKGIVHRDLKPANIKLTADGKVKVLDFGLAKAFDNDASVGNTENSPTLTLEATRAGMILGTAGYMSPEQARGKPVDKRADIWAFGVVLYEMLAGGSAFGGETVSDTLAAVLRADPDWSKLPAEVPAKVRRLLQRCLERDVKKRLRDIGDAWAEIDTPEEAAVPAARMKNRWWLYLAAGVAIGTAAGASYILWRTPAPIPRSVLRWSYTQKDYFSEPALSRDGTKLVYYEETGKSHLMLRMMDQAEGKPIPGSDYGLFPAFSPDGQWIATVASGKLTKIPVTGGTAMTLAEGAINCSFDWGENGEIAFGAQTGLMKVAAAGGEAQKLTTIDSAKGEKRHLTPQSLPGAKALVFTIESANSLDVALLDLKKGGYRVLVKDASSPRYVSTGHLLFMRGSTLFAVPFDAGRLELTGPAVPMIEDVETGAPYVGYSISDSGLLVYQNSDPPFKSTLAWADRKGANVPLSTPERFGTGRLSADGRRIAAAIGGTSTPVQTADIWIYETDRGTKTRLTFEGRNQFPIWTPDGQRVTFARTGAGKSGIYSVPADGSGKPELLLETEGFAGPQSWSPDGKMLVYYTSNSLLASLWVLPIDGGVPGKPYRLHDTNSNEREGQVSPDGKWLAYLSGESGSQEIYVQPFPAAGAKVRVSTEGGNFPRWSKDGRELFYVERRKMMSVDVQTMPQFRAAAPRELFTLAGSDGLWDTDGKRFLVEQIPRDESPHTLQGVVNWFDELRLRVPAGK